MSSLTSLQSVLCDRAAVDAQTSSSVGSHLDLVLCPDDQIFQQTVVGLWAAYVLLLVVPWQPCQTVPIHTCRNRNTFNMLVCSKTSKKSKQENKPRIDPDLCTFMGKKM